MPNPSKKKNKKDKPDFTDSSKTKTTQSSSKKLVGQAFIGLGPTAKQKVFHNFSTNCAVDYDILPLENGQIPQLKITQVGLPPIYTTDYYYTNIPPKTLMVIRASLNKDTSQDKAAAAPQLVFEEDPYEVGETCISAQEVHRQNIPCLDLQDQNITSQEELQAAFESLNLCSRCKEEAEEKTNGTTNPK